MKKINLLLLLAPLYSCGEYVSSVQASSACAPLTDWEGQCIDTTGVAGASSAIQSAVNSLPPYSGNPAESVPQVLDLPAGALLRIDAQVVIDRPVVLRGNGSRLIVDDGITAILATSPTPNAGGSDYSLLQDIWITGSGFTNGSTAIDVRRHGVRVDRASCFRMETCFKVRGQYNEEGGNANAQRWSNLVARSCGTAFDVSGGDAQIGLYSGAEILSCDAGVVDSSAFGNVWVGVSTEGMRGPGFDMDKDSGYATVIGGYQEHGEHEAHIRGRSALVVGGNLPSYLDDNSQADRIGMQNGALRFKYQGGPTVRIPGFQSGDVMSWNWQSGETANGQAVSEFQNFRLTWDEQLFGWSFWHAGAPDGQPQNVYRSTRSLTLVGEDSQNVTQGHVIQNNVESINGQTP
jgi:hypothetical protein